MDPQVQASFIPKKSLDMSVSRGSGVGLFFLIALLIFVTSVVAAGGAFLYQQYLNKTLADKKVSLDRAQGAYEPGTIQDLSRMDQRITQAKSLLGKHIAPSALFAFLSNQTLEKVSFSTFSFALQNDGSAKIALSGKADSFSTVALQSDQFGGSKVLKDVIFSGITIGQGGEVDFSVSAAVDPSLILYATALQSASTAQTQ
ncbi:MAG: hypothetical protein Q7R71_02240 [bacterium]|nr:hypothetical protein [bacterium]